MALSLTSAVQLNSGHSMPRLGFGVWASVDAIKSVSAALEVGYRHIDSARMYRNEAEVAEAVKQSKYKRSDIFITTKVAAGEHGYKPCFSAVEDSIKQSKLDYFDLVLLHGPQSGKARRIAAYKALEEHRQNGNIRSIGVSNYGVRHLNEINEAGLPTPAINQIEIHPWCQQKEIVSYCQTKGIIVQAYCPLIRGAKMGNSTLVDISKAVSKTPAQVLLRWSLQKGLVPLPKSDTPSRIKENADIYDFELNKEMMAKLDELEQGKEGACSWNPVDSP